MGSASRHNSRHFTPAQILVAVIVLLLLAGLGIAGQQTAAKAATPQKLNSAQQPVNAAGTNLVISQVYGGGGLNEAGYKYDFIELFNPTSQPITMTSWSVQYASAVVTAWENITVINGVVGPGKYFLISESGGGVGQDIPTPDASASIAMSSSAGKVALVNTTTPISPCGDKTVNTCTDEPSVVDFVGYGSAADYEGTGAAPAGSATTTVMRDLDGCEDTDNNVANFSAVAITGTSPRPRNSESPAHLCSQGNPSPTVTSTPGTSECGQFTDVPSGSAFYPYVRCLACRSVLAGYTDPARCPGVGAPCFQPNVSMTRGQMAKVVSNAAGFSEGHSEVTFNDVPTSHTFYMFIQRLSSRNVVSGYSDAGRCAGVQPPCFLPEANVNRQQMSKFVALAATFTEPVPSAQQTFADVPSSNTFWEFIERLATRGVVSGYACGRADEPCDDQSRPYFRPTNDVTRGQASKFVSLAFFPNCEVPARK
ncbi:MAG: hypothetical protein QOH93_2229 [Chloroflexia bacterium]|jgi:hypothetical protein|nr:hypothetical protein [Chloroflexia bacterium]